MRIPSLFLLSVLASAPLAHATITAFTTPVFTPTTPVVGVPQIITFTVTASRYIQTATCGGSPCPEDIVASNITYPTYGYLITVRFTPTSSGYKHGYVTVADQDGQANANISFTVAPALTSPAQSPPAATTGAP